MAISNTEYFVEKCDFFDYLHPGGKDLSLWIAKNTDLNSNMKILDIACGRGTTVCMYQKEFGCAPIGIDINEKMIESAKRRALSMNIENNVQFLVGNALSLDFNDDSFDLVLNEGAITLSGDPEKAILEMIRVARPGTKIAFVDAIVDKKATRDEKKILADYLGIDELRTEKEWIDLSNKCGLKNVTKEEWWGIANLYKMRLNWKKKKLYTFGEKLKIFKEIVFELGLKDVVRLLKIEKKILKAYGENTIGTIVIVGTVLKDKKGVKNE